MTTATPTRSRLLLYTIWAAAVGAFVVFCVVLPAEFQKDPTGFGRITGLLQLRPPAPAKLPALNLNTWFFPAAYKSDVIQIPIKADGEVEYKIKMQAGQALVYSWQSDSGNVYYDFHGEPPNNPKGSQSYKVEEELKSAHGAFVAPFDGIHGWYWLNLTGQPIKITLNIAGFYESHAYVK